jgi:phosphonate transport system substrate-binding protein
MPSLPVVAALALVLGAGSPAGQASQPPAALAQLNPSPAATATVLRISAIPDQNPEKLNRLYGLVADELSESLGRKVVYVPMVDYSAAVTAFRKGDLDLVWFGGLTGVQARLQTPGARVLAQRDVDAAFHSLFIGNREATAGLQPIRTTADLRQLRGRRFTFGSESSTSGRLMPQHFLQQGGVKLTDFAGGGPGFSGSHDATIALVQSGAYDAGAVNEQVWTSALRKGSIDRSKVVVLWRTPPYPDYHWVAQGNLDRRFGPGFTGRLQAALVALKPTSPRRLQILDLFGARQFVVAPADQYGQIEAIGRQLGKIR